MYCQYENKTLTKENKTNLFICGRFRVEIKHVYPYRKLSRCELTCTFLSHI